VTRIIGAAGLLVLVMMGCATAPEQPPERLLPFHVGLVPVVVTGVSGPPAAADEDPAGEAEGVLLAFDDGEATTALAGALSRGAFARVTELRYPETVPREEFLALPPEVREKDQWWVERADQHEVDLILVPEIRFHGRVRTALNGAFWLNLPLFLLGGPMTWFVNDRSYFVDVQLRAEVFAVSPLASGHATLDSPNARLQQARAGRDEVPLDFIDRADHLGHYALSVLVPSGFLASESGSVGGELSRLLLDDLVEGLVRDIQAQSEQLVRADRLFDFFLPPESLSVVATAEGWELRGEVLLERGGGAAPAMKRGRLRWGGGTEQSFDLEERELVEDAGWRGAYDRYPFVFRLPPGDLPECAQLELVDASANEDRRTYMVPVRALAESRP
jgi:hypothetical protein